MSHTRTPWAVAKAPSGQTCVISEEAWICGQLANGNGEEPGEGDANAAFIVKACNAHEDLINALSAIEADCEFLKRAIEKDDPLRELLLRVKDIAALAEKAITKAGAA